MIDLQAFILGARTDSNRRHSEPQSDALTNYYGHHVGFAGAKVREKFGLTKLFPYFFPKNFSLRALQVLQESQQRVLHQL